YLDGVDNHRVLSNVTPGQIASQFPAMPKGGRSYDDLLAEFESKILPGVTHWNHPAFFAYFAITGSQAGILAELLMAALNLNGMIWKTAPSVTELETVTLAWLRTSLGLPDGLFGIINDTASINSFLALAAARESLGLGIRGHGMTGRNLPPLRVYCSEHAHSSIEKGALALGFGQSGVVQIESDDALRMRPDAIEVNPHKWLFTPIDCSVLYTKKPDVLRETFSLIPEYLKTTDTAEVNYMDYGLQLGRRFRALKLWMIMEHYGLERMRAVIRGHVEYAERLAAELQKRDDVELIAPQMFSVVVFRKVVRGDEAASERATMDALERMNASG